MSKAVHTVCGKISPDELGFTQCHEHICLTKGKSFEINPALCIDNPKLSLKEVFSFKEAGGKSVVDAQPVGCNRDSENLKRISEKTGVNIIASTGFHKLMFYPENHWIRTMDEKRLTEIYVHELLQGMYINTDKTFCREEGQAKAGILKVALDCCNLEGRYETLFKAAAAAKNITGAPMMVHIEKGSDPEKLVNFLKEQGIDFTNVYFCHMDRACDDFKVFRNVLKEGVSLEFDTIGRFKYHSDEVEIELIKRILNEGYEDYLTFSLDTTRERLRSYNPDAVGLTYILKTFIPMMEKARISKEQIKKLSHENPKRLLAWI